MPTIAAAIVPVVAAAAPVAVPAAVGLYAANKQRKTAKEAADEARLQTGQLEARLQTGQLSERQAGEYYDLTEKQMQIQAMQSQTRTLAELIKMQDAERQPQFYTLPTAQPTSVVEQINQVIDKFIRG